MTSTCCKAIPLRKRSCLRWSVLALGGCRRAPSGLRRVVVCSFRTTTEVYANNSRHHQSPSDEAVASRSYASQSNTTLRRRTLLTALSGALLAEGAGQVIEHGVAHAGNRHEHQQVPDCDAARYCGARPSARDVLVELEDDARRCLKITGLAAVGAVGIDALRHTKAVAAKTHEARLPLFTAASSFKPDLDRHAVTISFSACYAGLFQPHWFTVLNSCDWQHVLPSFPEPLQDGQAFIVPLLINQLVIIPTLYWPSFFLFNGVVHQQTLSEVALNLAKRLPQVMKANLTFWIPAQGFQFAEIPAEQQSTYVAVMGILWNALLSVLATPDSDAAS